MTHVFRTAALTFALITLTAAARPAFADERLCDASFEDCRTPLLALINNEQVGIDVAFWFMEDKRYSDALIKKAKAGVPVRVIMDTESNNKYKLNAEILQEMKLAGIPMLEKTSGGIVHWKTMIFAGQNVVEFSGANFSPHAFEPNVPYVDYIDEVIYFSDSPSIVNSFKTKFDDHWTATSGFTVYANIPNPRTRTHATYPLDPEMNFPPNQNFATRSVGRYNAETQKIDSIMFRITDSRHTDALIAAMGPPRFVPVRLITDRAEYRDPTRLWHAYNVDRLYAAGAQVRLNAHQGDLHQKSTLLYGLQTTIFGSSNWTSPSANSQLEHNIFTKKPWFFEFFRAQFERKWNNETGHAETMPFVPLPPDAPQYLLPANAATEQPLTVTLTWNGGLWAHVYDVYFGTTPNPPLLAGGLRLGPSENPSDLLKYTVAEPLQPGTTYYWKVVSKTMAGVERAGQVWNFRTSGGAPPTAGAEDVVLYASKAPVRVGGWSVMADSTAAGSARIVTPNNGVKASVSATPADYFEMTFNAAAGVGYRLWIRGKAAGNSWGSDSVFVQFSDSVTAQGAPTYQIGTTSAATVTIEDCSGCGLSSWGWNDNAYGTGALGPLVYFAASGQHTIRVLMREDGLSIDQIVLSQGPFLEVAPGATKNDGTILVEQGGGSDPPPTPQPTLPAGWESRDIGAVGVPGSASFSNGVFTVRGAGADIWNATDAFHFAHTSLTGDGTIVARLGSVSGSQAWTKIGVMMRGSTAANSAYALMLASLTKGFAFQRRTADGVAATGTPAGAGTAPRWLRLVRTGDTITAALSSDGALWTVIGSDTFAMPQTILVGLAAHSHTTSELATGLFDSVTVTGGSGGTPVASLPEGWTSDDIGNVGVAGTAFEADGTFTVRGAGADVWGTADAFHYAYQPMSGDGAIVARVASLAGSQSWVKLGVMIRDSVEPDAAYAFMLVSRSKGIAFQRRTAAAVPATGTPGGAGAPPRWVKLERTGDVIAAFASADGADWTFVGSDVFTMTDDVLVGLAASSHDQSELATGTFDNVAAGSE